MAEVIIERRPLYRSWYYPRTFIGRVVHTVIGIIQFVLALRFLLLFFAANASAPFVSGVYGATDALVAPFAGAFPAWHFGIFVFDLSTLFAMVGYAILGWLVLQLVALFDA